MSSGYTSYTCICGGEIFEEWDSYGSTIRCNKCDNPKHPDDKRPTLIEDKALIEQYHFSKTKQTYTAEQLVSWMEGIVTRTYTLEETSLDALIDVLANGDVDGYHWIDYPEDEQIRVMAENIRKLPLI